MRGGSHFDPEIPLAIEVHLRFWDERTERCPRHRCGTSSGRGATGKPWTRPTRWLYARCICCGTCCGQRPRCNVYEIAWFLEHHAADRSSGIAGAIACAGIAAAGSHGLSIGARVVRAARWARLPRKRSVRAARAGQEWFEAFAFSPLESEFHPNKDELWLHLALLDSTRDQWL